MKFDNPSDAKQKLAGTYCYYKGQAVLVKEITTKYKDGSDSVIEIVARLLYLNQINSRSFTIPLTDPDFQYQEFNVGYLNQATYAVWYYRVPSRQYKQGLHHNQCGVRDKSAMARHMLHEGMGANENTAAMMENRYPSFEEAIAQLENNGKLKVAFDRNFAVYKDKLRGDYVIEHKGYPAAFGDVRDSFKCADNMKWLKESIHEMKIKVA